MVNEAQEVKFGTIPQWIRSRELSLTQICVGSGKCFKHLLSHYASIRELITRLSALLGLTFSVKNIRIFSIKENFLY